ncbi:hypothetical protein AZE42_14148 [Rhizopogon vesiculosus]|uniref:Uncharacterized protein n=1 Tax=Rhizopogon vesiculosus TaxID=180088 RepID=A0A1J8QP93_9AGAM|nr:hypothetical protein AZE42_14148 [Rhizopogon vesiculosus]
MSWVKADQHFPLAYHGQSEFPT